MNHNIDTIFFDIGNTLRIVIPDAKFQAEAEAQLIELVGTTEPHDIFFEKLETNWQKFRKQAKSGGLDMSEMELWMQWLLPGYDPDKIAAVAPKLMRLWRDHDGRRVPRPGTIETIVELDRRGYKLGIIANTVTETEIPDWLLEDKIAKYFKAVILSSKVRLRKPDPAIHLLASRAINSEPAFCAYLGDNPSRDVEGTRKAGYGMMILISEPDTIAKEPPTTDLKPDFIIRQIPELLNIFPPRK
jgi:putative hydrolase of the HAD superfamily